MTSASDGAQPVCNDDSCATERRQIWLHAAFSDRIQLTGAFVEEQDGGPVNECPGQRDALSLTAGQRPTAVAKERLVPHGHGDDVVVNAGSFCGFDDRGQRAVCRRGRPE
jgi:hypothetical protein